MVNKERFKFRAWDTSKKIMFYDVQDTYDFNYTHQDNEELTPAEHFGQLLLEENIIVEQSTGLKDKNGKLIYEGDIVSAITFAGHNRQFIVKYAEEDACFGLFVSKSMYISFNKVYEDSFEVIGNVHENPELLEE